MSHNSYELRKKKIEDEKNTELVKLQGENQFNVYDLIGYQNKIKELKEQRPYIALACVSIGSLITVIICHFIK